MYDRAIKVTNVTKSFRVHREKNNTLKEKVLYAGRAKYVDFVALQSVSLEIEQGSTVGLIGTNGSGKSTLLKIISRILYPDVGTVQVRGRVSSLLELGAGFHPDFTGLENIFLNGSLMGLSKRELKRKLDAIVEFSELGDFITEPIRGYSSGMYMRLAFSIATAIDPDVLLLDEILAVGDAAFQAKCMTRLAELKRAGKTIVIVSHDANAIESVCDEVIWLHHSKIREIGNPKQILSRYIHEITHKGSEIQAKYSGGTSPIAEDEANMDVDHKNDQEVNDISAFSLKLEKNAYGATYKRPMLIKGKLSIRDFEEEEIRLAISIIDQKGEIVSKIVVPEGHEQPGNLCAKGYLEFEALIKSVDIPPGDYELKAYLLSTVTRNTYALCVSSLRVESPDFAARPVSLEYEWKFRAQ